MKTRDRILEKALALFNRYGERSVTTNHIAEALEISPGNLYYHFRNKGEIVFDLFLRYEQEVRNFLTVPEGRVLTWQDKMGYLESVFQTMWKARFFHRELAHLLQENEQLRHRYNQFVRSSMDDSLQIYRGLAEAGLIEATEEEMQALLVNTWVLAASWATFVHAIAPAGEHGEALDKALLSQGIYQIICLEAPYLRNEALAHLDTFKARYRQGQHTLDLLRMAFMGEPESTPSRSS